MLAKGRKCRTGLILSGGGARGFAHAGAIKALNESGIFPDVVSGVSAGAIVGTLYADGYTADEIYKIFSRSKSIFQYVKVTIPRRGLFKTTGLRKNLKKYLRAKTFHELKLPLYIAATDINKGSIVYFNSGTIIDKVLASTAIPVLFKPVRIDGNTYTDGGVLDNFPVSPVAEDCHRLIGIYLNPIIPEDDFNSLFSISERVFRLSISANAEHKKDLCDIIIDPQEIGKFGSLDVTRGKEMFDMGYAAAKAKL